MNEQAKNPEAIGSHFSPAYRQGAAFSSTPFDSSAINYEKFGEQLLRVLTDLAEGAVIAIDGPWGSGKTYFGKNFVGLLEKNGWKVTYVDAFAFDYVEDPFIFLASAIRSQVSDTKIRSNFLSAAGEVGKALLPVAAKALIKVGTANLVDIEKAEEALADAAGSAAEKAVEARIKEFEKEKKSFDKFKERLAELAAKTKEQTGHPLVVFVDELDRCRPDFAVRTLERIKHLFDVPCVSFVLLLHRIQLQYAVQGLYGMIDAEAYLRKFIHFNLALPFRQKDRGEIAVTAYARYLAGKISLGDAQPKLRRFVQMLECLAPGLHMTLRDIERAFLTFILHRVNPRTFDALVDVLAYAICLKVMNSELYNQVLRREVDVGSPKVELFLSAAATHIPEHYRPIMRDVIETHLAGKANPEAVKRWSQLQMFTGPDVERAFQLVVDLD
jgi:energy-coupling factor transporter ATP-binding protein EcfA2